MSKLPASAKRKAVIEDNSKKIEQDPYLLGITAKVDTAWRGTKQVSTLGPLSKAIRNAGKERMAQQLKREVPPAFFIMLPFEERSFFGGYKYRGGKFVPMWFGFTTERTEGSLALFSTREEADKTASQLDEGAVVVALNTHQ